MGSELSRRGFLSGLIQATTATTLVIAASPKEIATFGRQSQVHVGETAPDAGWGPVALGDILYNRHGVALAIVDGFQTETEKVDVGIWGERMHQLIPGLTRFRLTAVCNGIMGPVR